ncbi:MAG: FAD-dependent monooxygenase [Acidobacteriia bacterium]|nr:FAD-dependent monooxygenase [Terriglobia bacterium]
MAEGDRRRRRFTIVGAGLGGALTAVFLGRRGHEVRVFERRNDPRTGPLGRSRSINLAISVRGLHALEQVGLAAPVLEAAVPMRGRRIHAPSGAIAFQPYGSSAEHVLRSVSRAALNRILVEAAESIPNVEVTFGRRCVGVELDRAAATFEVLGTGAVEVQEADAVVGGDGAFSEVRAAMQRTDRFECSQSYLEHGYKELTIPPGRDGRHALEPDALHIWPRGGFMTIALPNRDGSFTCTCFWPFDGEHGFSALTGRDEVLAYFERVFPDLARLIPGLDEEFRENPVGSLVTVRCAPWHHRGRAVLLGDAAHAVVPFYGQGANAAFEDCVVLDECLVGGDGDLEGAFRRFESRRKEHADALADLALGNFVEMRDRTASRLFLAGKKAEKVLNRLFPRSFVPLYQLVTFSRTPYADAVRRARRQWRAVFWAFALLGLGLLAAASMVILR